MTPRISLLIAARAGDTPALAMTLTSIRRQAAQGCDVVVAAPLGQLTLPNDETPSGAERYVEVETTAVPAAHVTAALLASALEAADGTYCAVLAPGDELEPGALDACLHMLDGLASIDVLYTDEQWPGTGSSGIFSKPHWSPHYLESYPYLGRLCLARTALLRAAGGFRPGFGGAEEWDAALRVTEGPTMVRHLPVVAVTRLAPPATDAESVDAGIRAVREHLARTGSSGTVEPIVGTAGVRVWRTIDDTPRVTIIVPTAGAVRQVRDQSVRLVVNALSSLSTLTTYPHWDVVVVTGPNTPDEVHDEVAAVLGERVRFTHLDGPFNFARAINEGARHAGGDLLLLLNDDTEVLEPRWLERLVSVIQEPTVGVVGAKLVFEDGGIQHVGVMMGEGLVPAHGYAFEADDDDRFGAKRVDRDFSAVTGACLLTRLDLFRRVGGLTEALPLNFNDVDYCLKVGAAGFAVVCTPFAKLAHYESSTRTPELTSREEAFLQRWWALRLSTDPHIEFRSDR